MDLSTFKRLSGILLHRSAGGGSVEREMALGSDRCDLLIEYTGERFVIEMKIRYD
jgi:hypothetical protein